MGNPGFPIPLLQGVARPDPPAGGGVGKPGFPMPPRDEKMKIGSARVRGPPARIRRGLGKPDFPSPPLHPGTNNVTVHTWGNRRACERGRFAPVASPRARCPRSQEKCEHLLWESNARPHPPAPWGPVALPPRLGYTTFVQLLHNSKDQTNDYL